jgi:hypothetical protein
MFLLFVVSWASIAHGLSKSEEAISFETFANFKRVEKVNPIIAPEPPLWAAATHAILIDNTVHYI